MFYRVGLFLWLIASSVTANAQVIGLNTHALQISTLGKDVKPTAINSSGLVVGQNASGVAFQWNSGVFTALGTLGGTTSYATDVNDSGTIVGYSLDNAGLQKAFKYEGSTLTNVDFGTTTSSAALAISNEGKFVGWKSNGSVYRSSLWDAGSPNGGLIFGSLNSQATGINDRGQIVGLALNSSNVAQDGYYWNGTDPLTSPSGIIGTNYLPYAGINDNDLTGGQRTGIGHILLIGDSGATSLGKILPTDNSSIANSLNNQNLVVGESGQKGFVFDTSTSTMYNLNSFAKLDPVTFAGITITSVNGINDNKQFVGTYQDSVGDTYGFTGQFVAIPEPGTWAILVGGALLVLRQGKRRLAC